MASLNFVMTDRKLERFYQSGSAKIFMPKTYAQTIEVVLVNTAGGLTGGDEFGVRVGANGDTHLTVSTQTAERDLSRIGPAKCRNSCQYDGDWRSHTPLATAGNNFV